MPLFRWVPLKNHCKCSLERNSVRPWPCGCMTSWHPLKKTQLFGLSIAIPTSPGNRIHRIFLDSNFDLVRTHKYSDGKVTVLSFRCIVSLAVDHWRIWAELCLDEVCDDQRLQNFVSNTRFCMASKLNDVTWESRLANPTTKATVLRRTRLLVLPRIFIANRTLIMIVSSLTPP